MMDERVLPISEDALPRIEGKYWEPYSRQYLYLTKEKLIAAFSEANRLFYKHFFLSLNTLLTLLGGQNSPEFDQFGWSFENEYQDYCWGYFSPAWITPLYFMHEHGDYISIDYQVEPTDCSEEYLMYS